METIHIKFDFNEAVTAKKQILSCEMSTLKSIQKLQGFKKLRKEEFGLKSKLKTRMKQLKTDLNMLVSHLPQVKEKGFSQKVEKITKLTKLESRKLESELQDISERLESLS